MTTTPEQHAVARAHNVIAGAKQAGIHPLAEYLTATLDEFDQQVITLEKFAGIITMAEAAVAGALRGSPLDGAIAGLIAAFGTGLLTCRDYDPTAAMLERAARYYTPPPSTHVRLAKNLDNLIVDLTLDVCHGEEARADRLDRIKENLKFAQRQIETAIEAVRVLEKEAV